MPASPRRSASKRSRKSNDTSSNPTTEAVNTTESKACSLLNSLLEDKLSLSSKVTKHITENAIVMQEGYAEMLQRRLARGKISAQDQTGACPIVKSAKADNYCPVTAPKKWQNDPKMKEIQAKKAEADTKHGETSSDFIREAATRFEELSIEEFQDTIVKTIHELAIDFATTARVRGEFDSVFLPSDVTDIQLGNAAAMEYITTTIKESDESYEFESAEKFAVRYSNLYHVPVPKTIPETNIPLTQPSQMETEEDEDPLKKNQAYITTITKIKNLLNDVWPAMTTPFWNEHKETEMNRIINRDTSVRTTARNQENANRSVSLNLESLQNNPESFLDSVADAVEHRRAQKEKERKQKQKKDARKKSLGNSKKNQDTKPTSNGQSKKGKSKKDTEQQNQAKSSNNRNQKNSRGGGRGNDHQGGRGKGRGRGRGRGGRGRR